MTYKPGTIEKDAAKVQVKDTGTTDGATIEFLVDPDNNGTSTKAWEITGEGHFVPAANNTFDVGSPSNKVRELYVDDSSIWLGDNHKLEISSGKIRHKKRKSTSGFTPNAFSNLTQGSYNRSQLLAIKKTSNGGDGSGGGDGGSAANETELTLSDWIRYANANSIDGAAKTRFSRNGGPQAGKWKANDIFNHTDDFEEDVDPSSPSDLSVSSFASSAKATSINDSSPSATKFPTETAVKNHVDTKISAIALSLNNLSDVSTSSVSSGQVLKYNGSSWAPAADSTGGGGGDGGGGTTATVTKTGNSTSISLNSETLSNSEATFFINTSASAAVTVSLPGISANSIANGYKINIKRITTDPITITHHTGASTETIDNSTAIDIPYRYSSVTFQTDSSKWWVI